MIYYLYIVTIKIYIFKTFYKFSINNLTTIMEKIFLKVIIILWQRKDDFQKFFSVSMKA
jgi:hypothetical protein